MALPGNIPPSVLPPALNNLSSQLSQFDSDDYAVVYYPPSSGSLGIITIPALNNYNVFWTEINTSDNEIISIGGGASRKGYYFTSNDKRDLFEIDQVLQIGDTTFKIDEITYPDLQINEKTEIISSGNLTENVSTDNISMQITINVTINRV